MSTIYVFDMGGVILRPSNLLEVYHEGKSETSYNDFKKLFYDSEYSDRVYKGIIDDKEFFETISYLTRSNFTYPGFKESYLKCKSGLYESTVNYIKWLKDSGNKVCLLSNLKVCDYEYLSKNLDMSLFDKEYLSYELNMSKPNEDIFKYVINDLGTNEFVFYDDNSKNIDASLKLGIKAKKVTGEYFRKVA